MTKNRIGLALSGGGYRALVFHLGALSYFAEQGLLKQVKIISTVSGGSLAPALILKHSNMTWPDNIEFIEKILPAIKKDIISRPLTLQLIWNNLLQIHHRLNSNSAKILANALESSLKITQRLEELPHQPKWIINATPYESGKNWRFTKNEMGDWITGYVKNPSLKISEAVAASCAFPGLIGSLKINTSNYNWVEKLYNPSFKEIPSTPKIKNIHLWDGALYENLGLEPLFKPGKGLQNNIDKLICIDASYSEDFTTSRTPFDVIRRLLDISLRATQSLRTRMVWDYIHTHPTKASYIKIGRTLSTLQKDYMIDRANLPCNISFMDDKAVTSVAAYPTNLSKMDEKNYNKLFQHGYQVAQVSSIQLLSDLTTST